MTRRVALAALLADPAVARALTVLAGGGEETRIVGGAVRNALIGHPTTDVDMATTATIMPVTASQPGAPGTIDRAERMVTP